MDFSYKYILFLSNGAHLVEPVIAARRKYTLAHLLSSEPFSTVVDIELISCSFPAYSKSILVSKFDSLV